MRASSEKHEFPQPELDKKYINGLELVHFNGPIKIISTPKELRPALRKLAQEPHIGFDTESKPVFVKGEYNHVSLMQLSTLEEVFLVRLNKVGITQEMKYFLENPNSKKIGLALANDLSDLRKLTSFEPAGFIDIQNIMRREGIKTMGLRKLCALLLNFRISKGAQVSNWEADILSEKQIRYAATDAWACLKIHHKLIELGIEEPRQ